MVASFLTVPVQMLSPAIPCHYHDTDIKMRNMLMRHLGALRRAIHSLESYYHDVSRNLVSPSHNPFHPYPTSFTTQDGLVKRFKYLSSMRGRNLFFGNIDDDDGAATPSVQSRRESHFCLLHLPEIE